MEKDLNLGQRIAWLRKNRGLEQKEAARGIGISIGSLQIYEYGTKPSLKNLAKIKKFYGCNEIWLLTGEGQAFAESTQYRQIPVQPDFPCDDYVLIRQVKGKISAGLGLVPNDATDLCAVFRKDWISKKGSPQNMSLIKVRGDSMEPTFLEGDLVLVDHSRNHGARQGGIYAIVLDDEIMIKRLQALHQEGMMRIISDNKNYPPL